VVNIAAVMAALDVWDLDHAAKHALVTVCCRADRHTGIAVVPVSRLAADMKVSYKTARLALLRAVDAGYLAVDKRAGAASTWRLTSVMVTYPRREPGSPGVGEPGSPTKESLEKTISASHPAQLAGAGENHRGYAASRAEMNRACNPDNIAACPYCDEHGWLYNHDNHVVGRCDHQRATSELTLDDVLNATAPHD
jgi:hypothetical protein